MATLSLPVFHRWVQNQYFLSNILLTLVQFSCNRYQFLANCTIIMVTYCVPIKSQGITSDVSHTWIPFCSLIADPSFDLCWITFRSVGSAAVFAFYILNSSISGGYSGFVRVSWCGFHSSEWCAFWVVCTVCQSPLLYFAANFSTSLSFIFLAITISMMSSTHMTMIENFSSSHKM